MANVVPLKPVEHVDYRGFRITLTYRPGTNDWAYEFAHVMTLPVRGHGRSYMKALADAKRRADIIVNNSGSTVRPAPVTGGDAAR